MEFTCIVLNTNYDKQIALMKKNHPGMIVTDLANAIKTKSSAEVTKMFVDSTSFILRNTVGASKKKSDPLWDTKQNPDGCIFSSISYLKVESIDGDKISVKTHTGESWIVSKDILSS